MTATYTSLKVAYGAIHLAALFFGLAAIFGVLITADALFITLARALFAALFLLLILIMRRQPPLPYRLFQHKTNRRHFLGAITFLAVHWFSFFIAVKKGGVAIATLGFASFPAFTLLIEYIFINERLSKSDVAAIAFISLGLILINPSISFQDQSTIGLIWGIISGFSFAFFTFLNRRLSQQAAPLQIAFGQSLGVFLLSLPFGWAALGTVSLADWFWAALLGIFCTALAHYLIILSLQTLKARHAGIIIALEPVYAIIFAALLFQHYPDVRVILGAVLIISTIIWSQRQQQRHSHK